jgi:Skp family chaperone for outer membrane proteins
MIRRLLPLVVCLLAVRAAAVVVEINLPWKNLRLKNGLTFPEATVRSVNTAAGTALLLVDKELVSVRTAQLPDDLTAKLKELTPAQTETELAEAKAQDAADRKRAADRAERRQLQAEEEARAVRTASRELNVKKAAETTARYEAIPDEVAKFAEQRARAYFRYQADPNSNIGAVVSSDIMLDNPEPVPGWGGRYRVEGVAYRQYVNNQASGFGRTGQEFEMLIQTHADTGKKPEIVEIRIK